MEGCFFFFFFFENIFSTCSASHSHLYCCFLWCFPRLRLAAGKGGCNYRQKCQHFSLSKVCLTIPCLCLPSHVHTQFLLKCWCLDHKFLPSYFQIARLPGLFATTMHLFAILPPHVWQRKKLFNFEDQLSQIVAAHGIHELWSCA